MADGPAPPPARRTLLVIDDEPMMVRAIERLLAGEYDMVTTTDPIDAVERIRAGSRFDAVLCDLMMPTMSGIEVYETIRGIEPEQARRIVFMTGGAFTARALAFLASVDNARIEKPLERAALRAAIRSVPPPSL